jgi:hypothetical protein
MKEHHREAVRGTFFCVEEMIVVDEGPHGETCDKSQPMK